MDSEESSAATDALVTGTGIMQGGQRIDPCDFFAYPEGKDPWGPSLTAYMNQRMCFYDNDGPYGVNRPAGYDDFQRKEQERYMRELKRRNGVHWP